MTLLDGLNPVQRSAVLHREGPMLLLAGAGSGKTRVVTHRIASLLADGEPASSIVAVTFTNRAAREMAERVEALLDAPAPELTICTFHALGARFLRRHGQRLGRTPRFTIYDEADRKAVAREALADVGVTEGSWIDATVAALEAARNAGRGSGELHMPPEMLGLDTEAFGAAYDRRMKVADAFDFGELILRPAELLRQSPELAATYRARWKWILVDEFQDTNPAQYQWLQLLAPPGSNLFVVGDDDQSIYGWRGAEVEHILRFPEVYGCEPLRLEQNYRSDGLILRAANQVIANNRRRLGKNLWTDRGEGMRLEVHQASDQRAEAAWVSSKMLLGQEDYAPSDLAVLMRANHLSLDVEQSLLRHGIPYAVLRGRAFYERAEIRDAVAYLRLLVNPHDEVAFRRAVGVPPRGVGAKSLDKLSALAAELGCSLWDAVEPAIEAGRVRGKAAAGLRAFKEVLEAARDAGLPPSETLKRALEEAGFASKLLAFGRREAEGDDRQKNVESLLIAIHEYEKEAAQPDLAEYLEQIKLVSDADGGSREGVALTLTTVHAAKGLEWPVVFVIGMEEGLFPHERSIESDDVEEERRLCYVAITRARDRLRVSMARTRRTFGDVRHTRPSRFLSELPADVVEARYEPVQSERPSYRRPPVRRRPRALPVEREPTWDAPGDEAQWRKGMMVWHAQYGAGRVLGVQGGMRTTLRVDFPDLGPTTVIAKYVSPYEG